MTIHPDTVKLIMILYYFARVLSFVDIRPFNLLIKFNWFLDFITVLFLGTIAVEVLNDLAVNEAILFAIHILTAMTAMEIIYPVFRPYMVAYIDLIDRLNDKKKGVSHEQI